MKIVKLSSGYTATIAAAVKDTNRPKSGGGYETQSEINASVMEALRDRYSKTEADGRYLKFGGTMTQAQYDALSDKDDLTIYAII